MMSQTTDAGRTPTQRATPPIQTFLRVIVVSFVALILFAIPREGAVQPPSATRVIVGSGIGGQSKVRVFDGTTAAPLPGPLGSFTAFTQNPGGEVRVAGCDLNGDGTDDIIASTGLGTRAEVRVFDGASGLAFPGIRGSFLAFENGFLGGVHVACGNLTADSIPDIIAARGALGKPEVRVFNGATGARLPLPLGSFFAFEQQFLGGVRVAACDLNQDGKTEIIAARGPGAQPQIRTFNGATGAQLGSFLAFDTSDRGGVYVACGDLAGDPNPEIIAGKGLGKPPKVRVFNGATGAQLPLPVGSFDAFDPTFPGGVRVASCKLNQDGATDILAGRGPGAQPEVRAFDGVSGTPFPPPMGSFLAFGASFKGGVYVACSPSDSGVCPEITVSPTTLAAGTAGQAYGPVTFTRTGGTGIITWSVSGGALPTGMNFSTAGVLSGTPTQTGNFPLTYTATDAEGCTGEQAITLVINTIVCQPITVTPPSVTTGQMGVAFNQTFTQSGASGAATFSLASGTLPTGLTLATNGNLSGTPTQSGSFPITVKVTDGTCVGTSPVYNLVIQVIPPDAVNDTYPQTVIGNVSIDSGLIPFSAISNDQFTGTATISAFDATSVNGGTVTMVTSGPDIGKFTYNPPAGFAGTDSFTYTLSADGGTDTATVSFTVSGMVWFINNTAAACTIAGCGRLSNPYSTLAAFNATAADATGDNIFLYESGTNYTGATALLNGQKLIGQDATASLAAITGLTPPSGSAQFPAMNSGNLVLTNIASTVTLNTNSTVRGLSIATTGVVGMNDLLAAISGVSVSEVAVSSTNAAGVSLSDLGGTVSFRRVSASGATNGIVLTNTTGSFTVTGTGVDGTGGAIGSTTGDGVSLNSASTVSLSWMNINNNQGNGIRGTNVSGLTLNNSVIQFNGDGDNEHGVNLVDATGTFLIDHTTFNGAAEDLVQITNTNTNLTLTVQNGSHFEYPNPWKATHPFANSAILLRPFGSSALTVSVQGNTFKNIVNNSLLMGGDNAVSGTRTATFSNNTVTVDAALNQSCSVNPECRVGGVVISARNTSTTNFVATGNTFTRASGAGVIELGSNETATLKARVENNNISNSLGDGVKIASFQDSRMILQFNGNTLTNIGGDGFQVEAGDSIAAASSDMDLVLTNNTINGHTQNPAIQFVGGIGIFRFGDADQLLCLKLTGNTVTGTPVNFFDVYLDGNFGAQGGSMTYEGSGTGAVTDVKIKADNPGVTQANVSVSATNLSNGVACQLPGI